MGSGSCLYDTHGHEEGQLPRDLSRPILRCSTAAESQASLWPVRFRPGAPGPEGRGLLPEGLDHEGYRGQVPGEQEHRPQNSEAARGEEQSRLHGIEGP